MEAIDFQPTQARHRIRIGFVGLTVAVAAFVAGSVAAAGPAAASSERAVQTEDEEVTLDFDGCSTNVSTGETTCIPAGQRVTERALCDGPGDGGDTLALLVSTDRNNSGLRGYICVPQRCTTSYDNEGPRYKGNFNALFTDNISWVNTFHRCDVKLFNNDNQQGEASVWIDGHPDGVNLSAIERGLNNRANSYRLS
jgi:hypothetical protein